MPALLRSCVLLALAAAALTAPEPCYSAIQQLAQHDRQLGEAPAAPSHSRLYQKQQFAQSETTTKDFLQKMGTQRSQGTGYSCGYTADWVMEVFNGLASQYVPKRLGDYGNETAPNVKAGYVPLAGQEVIDFFTTYANFDDRVVFKLAHSPPIDHVLVVEQLPAEAGYRVYQSYNSVYGLNAWLAPASANLSAMFDNGDIMSNPKLAPMFNSSIQALFGSNVTLENLDDVPDALSPLVPVLKVFIHSFLGNNTKEAVLANFQKAQELYGRGQVISKADFFGTYLPKLAAMALFLKENWGTDSVIPQSVADAWLEMYGTSNLLIFAGVPVNLVPALIQSTATQYYLQASVMVVPGEDQCDVNKKLLAGSLLKSERRESIHSEDVFDAPQNSSPQAHGALIGGIAIIAALSMGTIFAVAKTFSGHQASKPMALDLEMTSLDVPSLPSLSESETSEAISALP